MATITYAYTRLLPETALSNTSTYKGYKEADADADKEKQLQKKMIPLGQLLGRALGTINTALI